MVLQQVAPRVHAHSPDVSRPDPVRIIGITGTLAFNAVLLTVLLLPASGPPVVDTRPDTVLAMRWLTPPPPTPPRPPVPNGPYRPGGGRPPNVLGPASVNDAAVTSV